MHFLFILVLLHTTNFFSAEFLLSAKADSLFINTNSVTTDCNLFPKILLMHHHVLHMDQLEEKSFPVVCPQQISNVGDFMKLLVKEGFVHSSTSA